MKVVSPEMDVQASPSSADSYICLVYMGVVSLCQGIPTHFSFLKDRGIINPAFGVGSDTCIPFTDPAGSRRADTYIPCAEHVA